MLKKNEDLSLIGVNWMWFGSSGYVDQPSSIVQTFLKRSSTNMTRYPALLENYKVLKPTKNPEMDWQKYIVNTAFKVDNIDIHNVMIEGTSSCLSNCIDPINPVLLINHYATQSREYFLKVKGTRGDVNNWVPVGAKNIDWFTTSDINEIADTRLADQNKKFKIALEGNAKCNLDQYVAAAAATAASSKSSVSADAVTSAPVPDATAAPVADAATPISFLPSMTVSPEQSIAPLLSHGTVNTQEDAAQAQSAVTTIETSAPVDASASPPSAAAVSDALASPPVKDSDAKDNEGVYIQYKKSVK